MNLYDHLIERDLAAIPRAAEEFLEEHSPHELYLAVARFAVLAYSPSQHAKRAVMACRAAWDLRETMGESWPALLVECARYAAEARRPWSEPPILDALEEPDVAELEKKVKGDALLMLDAALALLPILGEKGKAALLRMPVEEMEAEPTDTNPTDPIELLIQRVIDSNGAVDTVRDVFIWSAAAKHRTTRQPANLTTQPPSNPATQQPSNQTLNPRNPVTPQPPVYQLSRDYAQTLIAHATPVPEPLRAPFLSAIHHNLAHGESFAEWSSA